MCPTRCWQLHDHRLATHAPLRHLAEEDSSRSLAGLLRSPGGARRSCIRIPFLWHPINLCRGERRSAAHDEYPTLVEGCGSGCRPRDGELSIEERPLACPHIEELDASQHLGATEYVVATTNHSKVIAVKRNQPCARSGHLKGSPGRPRATGRVVDLTSAEGLHEILARRGPRRQCTAAHGVDQAAQRGTTVTPTGAAHRGQASFPTLLDGVENLAARQHSIDNAPVVIATSHKQSAVGQSRCSAACAAGRHAGARDPLPMPRVEHLHNI
mmetsp:Transcript_44111/g.93927  ORF Transcript_44111/g.93927 Transcript_44111/m.93927 type:complete len:270 (+) Transcript_44111:404-1213(+)